MRRATGSRQDAEDAVQTACLRVWLSDKFRGESSLMTYLYRAARNEAVNQRVAMQTQKRGGGRTREELPDLPSTADPCQAAQYWRKMEASL